MLTHLPLAPAPNKLNGIELAVKLKNSQAIVVVLVLVILVKLPGLG